MVRSISDFVALLGGTGATADWAGTTDACVSNWMARGYLPPGYHLKALLVLQETGTEFAPEFFELTDEEAQKLRRPTRQAEACAV